MATTHGSRVAPRKWESPLGFEGGARETLGALGASSTQRRLSGEFKRGDQGGSHDQVPTEVTGGRSAAGVGVGGATADGLHSAPVRRSRGVAPRHPELLGITTAVTSPAVTAPASGGGGAASGLSLLRSIQGHSHSRRRGGRATMGGNSVFAGTPARGTATPLGVRDLHTSSAEPTGLRESRVTASRAVST
jgi:hypothetical protein